MRLAEDYEASHCFYTVLVWTLFGLFSRHIYRVSLIHNHAYPMMAVFAREAKAVTWLTDKRAGISFCLGLGINVLLDEQK